jgi:hypothetical protein
MVRQSDILFAALSPQFDQKPHNAALWQAVSGIHEVVYQGIQYFSPASDFNACIDRVRLGWAAVFSLDGFHGIHCRPHVRHDVAVSRQDDVAVSSSHEGEECACRA